MLEAPRSRCSTWISWPITSTSSARPARWRAESISSCLACSTSFETDNGGDGGTAASGMQALRDQDCPDCPRWPAAWLLQGHPHPPRAHLHRVRPHRVLGQLHAFAGAQIEVVLVERRCHDDALAQAAEQPAREHAGAALRIDVVDREELLLAEPEDGDVTPLDERAHAGVGQDVFNRADVGPGLCVHVEFGVDAHVSPRVWLIGGSSFAGARGGQGLLALFGAG